MVQVARRSHSRSSHDLSASDEEQTGGELSAPSEESVSGRCSEGSVDNLDTGDYTPPDGAPAPEPTDRLVDLALSKSRLDELAYGLPREAPLQEIEDTLQNEHHGTGHSVQWLLDHRDCSNEEIALQLNRPSGWYLSNDSPAADNYGRIVWMDERLSVLFEEPHEKSDPWDDPTLISCVRYGLSR